MRTTEQPYQRLSEEVQGNIAKWLIGTALILQVAVIGWLICLGQFSLWDLIKGLF